MRNLIIQGERRRSVAIEASPKEAIICDLCHVPSDDGSEDASVLLTPHGTLVKFSEEGSHALWVCKLDTICALEGKWFDVTYVDAIDAIVCLSHSGAIIMVSPATGEAELVGEFDHGLEAGKWSPDGEVLALVTFTESDDDNGSLKNSVLLTMTGEWEVLAEVTMERHIPSLEAESAAVSVCWRPDGTLCAVSTVDASDQTRRIRTYQKDTLDLQSVGRSEDGSGKVVPNLVGTAGVAWASGGCSHILTAVQRKSKKTTQVVFFEPNGLRHRDFPLRPEESGHATVMSLIWNVESDLLAVTLRDVTHDRIQLWHRCNYHWYMKQELRFDRGLRVSCTIFHDEQPYVLFVGLNNDQEVENADSSGLLIWREFAFRWESSTVGASISHPDSCTAISVDGCVLNVTPLEKALVPPPMYAASLALERPIRAVTFSPITEPMVAFLVQISDGRFVLFRNGGGGPSDMMANFDSPSVVTNVTWDNVGSVDITSLRHSLIMGEHCASGGSSSLHMIAVSCAPANQECELLVEIIVEWNDSGDGTASVTNTIPLEGRVLSMVCWSDSADGALLELQDGTLLEYSKSETNDGGSVFPSKAEPLLEPCPWLAGLKNLSELDDYGHRERLVVGLSHRSRLYCHDRLLADAASSFILSTTHKFLCYATPDGSRYQLRFLPLSELVNFDPLMGSDENHQLEGYEARNVERGTRLVAILPNNPSTILQLPRGNMEGVFPRALVLPYVMTKIETEEYGEAFSVMRRQKVDLNLIVDLDPGHFLESGVWKFLEEVRIIDYLNLFIATLQDTDITLWKYKVPAWFRRTSAHSEEEVEIRTFNYATKVNQVCQQLREIMMKAEQHGKTKGGLTVSDGHFLLPILSTFAKENPPKIEEALALIKENALFSHPLGGKKPPLFSEKAQSSIQYLAFLADYEMLFNTALGMYDYDLARAVARNSQMDPKVYLPLLKRLKSLPQHYAQYEVDVQLKRYESALRNLVKSGESEENMEGVPPSPDDEISFGNNIEQCMSLIEKYKLHRLGLELFEDQCPMRQRLIRSLGNRLLDENQAETALSIFLAAQPKDVDGAKRAAKRCGDWRCFFTLSTEGVDADESTTQRLMATAWEIAEEVSSGWGKHSKQSGLAFAARILLDYGHDVIGAVDMLISAEMWSEGRRVACLYSRQDLMKKCVDAAITYAETSQMQFEDRLIEFQKASVRYVEVLKIRKDAVREGDALPGDLAQNEADETGSLFSVGSNASNTSLMSNVSGSSMGSIASTSSVITVGAMSTFSLTGAEQDVKHKSKFNKIGGGKKKKKAKKGRGSKKKKMRKGSQEELIFVVGTLKENCVYDETRDIVTETIQFLVQVGKLVEARDLFNAYNTLKEAILALQSKRIDTAKKELEDAERNARREGQTDQECGVLPVEAEVDSLQCPNLPKTVHDVFLFL